MHQNSELPPDTNKHINVVQMGTYWSAGTAPFRQLTIKL